jgi:hypothetical protein
MASALYPKFKEALLGADVDLPTVNVKAVLVDTGDVGAAYNAAHQFLSDIPSGARVVTSGNLASKTITGGVFDAADITFTAAAGDPVEAIVLYVDSGTPTTSQLICFIDTVAGPAPLSITLNGGDVNVQWAAGGIFSL